jgi:hypothetical protein
MAVLSPSQIYQLALNSGFRGKSAQTATAIALAESNGNPGAIAYNDAGKGYNSYGLMQINGVHPGAANAVDPQTSMDMAFDISKGGTNFNPWTMYKNGKYANFLGSVDPSNVQGATGSLPDVPDFSHSLDPATGNSNDYTFLGPNSGLTSDSFSDTGTGTVGRLPNSDLTDSLSLSPDLSKFTDANQPFSAMQLPLGDDTGRATDGINSTLTNPLTGKADIAGAAEWWNNAVKILGDYIGRFGLVLLALILIGAGTWALARGRSTRGE